MNLKDKKTIGDKIAQTMKDADINGVLSIKDGGKPPIIQIVGMYPADICILTLHILVQMGKLAILAGSYDAWNKARSVYMNAGYHFLNDDKYRKAFPTWPAEAESVPQEGFKD